MYTLDSTVSDLFKNPDVKKALFEIAPGVETHPYLSMAMGMSLKQCAEMEPGMLNAKVLAQIEEALKKF
ncbi:MAG: hypothetical protein RR253_04615 [Oscillospiraceae bacterium]